MVDMNASDSGRCPEWRALPEGHAYDSGADPSTDAGALTCEKMCEQILIDATNGSTTKARSRTGGTSRSTPANPDRSN